VIVGINPLLGLAVGASFGIVVFFSRYVSLSSMVAAVFAPVYYVFGNGVAWIADNRVLLSMAVMAGLLIWRHYENINRLLKGTESRLGKKKPS
jgi:glycerol-3-phosphate acyltransferase PlsY